MFEISPNLLRKIILSILVIAGIIAVSIWQIKDQYSISKLPQQEYMKVLTVSHYTEDGSLKDKIIANFWGYNPTSKTSALIKPNIYIFKENGSQWLISANKGNAFHETIDAKVSKLDLDDNVVMQRFASSSFAPIKLSTAHVSYYPQQESVETTSFVEMLKPGVLITGKGLTSDLKKNKVNLLSDVKTSYLKEQTNG